MKKQRELETPSYWPGYVDALTNVVLNLLFMVGIFAIGIFALSMEAALKPKQRFPQSDAATARQHAALLVNAASASGNGGADQGGGVPASRQAVALASAKAAITTSSASANVQVAKVTASPRDGGGGHAKDDNGSVPQPLVMRVAGVDSERQPPVEWRGEGLRFVQMAGRPLTRVLFAKSDFSISDENRTRIADSLNNVQQGARLRIWTTVDDKDAQDRREGYLRVMSVRSSLIGLGISAEAIDAQIFVGAARGGSDSRRVTLLVN